MPTVRTGPSVRVLPRTSSHRFLQDLDVEDQHPPQVVQGLLHRMVGNQFEPEARRWAQGIGNIANAPCRILVIGDSIVSLASGYSGVWTRLERNALQTQRRADGRYWHPVFYWGYPNGLLKWDTTTGATQVADGIDALYSASVPSGVTISHNLGWLPEDRNIDIWYRVRNGGGTFDVNLSASIGSLSVGQVDTHDASVPVGESRPRRLRVATPVGFGELNYDLEVVGQTGDSWIEAYAMPGLGSSGFEVHGAGRPGRDNEIILSEGYVEQHLDYVTNTLSEPYHLIVIDTDTGEGTSAVMKADNLQAMVEMIRLYDDKVSIANVIPHGHNNVGAGWDEDVKTMRKKCRELGLMTLDRYNVLGDARNGGEWSENTNGDGVHLSAVGSAAWSAAMSGMLNGDSHRAGWGEPLPIVADQNSEDGSLLQLRLDPDNIFNSTYGESSVVDRIHSSALAHEFWINMEPYDRVGFYWTTFGLYLWNFDTGAGQPVRVPTPDSTSDRLEIANKGYVDADTVRPNISGAATRTIDQPGLWIHNSTGSTWTLPTVSDSLHNRRYTFFNAGTGNVTINRASTDTIHDNAGALTSIVMRPGDGLTMIPNAGVWYVVGRKLHPYRRLDTVAGSTYTVALGDNGRIKELTNATACAVSLPASLPTGFEAEFSAEGAGAYSFTTTGGATLQPTGAPNIAAQYGRVRVLHRGACPATSHKGDRHDLVQGSRRFGHHASASHRQVGDTEVPNAADCRRGVRGRLRLHDARRQQRPGRVG